MAAWLAGGLARALAGSDGGNAAIAEVGRLVSVIVRVASSQWYGTVAMGGYSWSAPAGAM